MISGFNSQLIVPTLTNAPGATISALPGAGGNRTLTAVLDNHNVGNTWGTEYLSGNAVMGGVQWYLEDGVSYFGALTGPGPGTAERFSIMPPFVTVS